MRSLRARITLGASGTGGRRHAIDLRGGYRPHLRVSAADMLGVAVVTDHASLLGPGETADVELQLLYDIDYSSLRPGVSFTIIEGANEVGKGTLL